ncbi:hypothetical protein BASA61_008986 [Batrachochytrium salamandrivorans]|nr:hypothetical protein BASA61_008986 [Batrachochytrium salamandrivorans]
MWIDTARYATCRKSANRAASARLSCLVPKIHAPQSPSNQRWSRSASPFKTPPRSQHVSTSPHRMRACTDPSSLRAVILHCWSTNTD